MSIRSLPILLICFVLALPYALAQEAETLDDYMRNGAFYLATRNCSFAQVMFQEALKLEPNNIEATIGKGRAITCLGNFSLGIEEFQKAITLDPNNTQARVRIAVAYQDQYFSDPTVYPNRLSEALAILEQAEAIDANNADVQNAKGVIFYHMGSFTEARAILERALILAQSDARFGDRQRSTININLGTVYRDLGELDLSESAFMRAVTLNPTSDEAHLKLGEVLFLKRRL